MDLFPQETEQKRYPLEYAELEARDLAHALEPFCHRIEIAGSIRRRRPDVHDIDIVVIPGANLSRFFERNGVAPKGGDKIVTFRWGGIPVDLYIADGRTWPTLFLIRTGSKGHNIMMCRRAREMNMCLHAGGTGLEEAADCHDVRFVDIATEHDIFHTLGLPYKEPWEREI